MEQGATFTGKCPLRVVRLPDLVPQASEVYTNNMNDHSLLSRCLSDLSPLEKCLISPAQKFWTVEFTKEVPENEVFETFKVTAINFNRKLELVAVPYAHYEGIGYDCTFNIYSRLRGKMTCTTSVKFHASDWFLHGWLQQVQHNKSN
jgi:hypothetical protein